nr:hypothetical protein [Tanacetum cinerariifolium]
MAPRRVDDLQRVEELPERGSVRIGTLGTQAGDRTGGVGNRLGHGIAHVAVLAPVASEATDEGI